MLHSLIDLPQILELLLGLGAFSEARCVLMPSDRATKSAVKDWVGGCRDAQSLTAKECSGKLMLLPRLPSMWPWPPICQVVNARSLDPSDWAEPKPLVKTDGTGRTLPEEPFVRVIPIPDDLEGRQAQFAEARLLLQDGVNTPLPQTGLSIAPAGSLRRP